MFYSILRTAFVLTAAGATISVQARVQLGFCGENGLDGITGTVPACMFLAGTTYNGHSFPYQLAISGITSCDQCTNGTAEGGIYNCNLYDCAEDDPYEPCGYASC